MEKEKISLLILFGGASNEHEVSCKSAASILRNIDKNKYNIWVIGITKEGKWLLTEASPEKIEENNWEKKAGNKEAIIYPDKNVHGIKNLKGQETKIDCVFPVLHGKYGEDGSIQGLLELSGIPYVGGGVLSSACAMDKAVTKELIKSVGIDQATYYVTDRYKFSSSPTEEIVEMEKAFNGKYPLFVKPANTGSSVGISKVSNYKELFEGIKIAAEIDHKIIIEENIVGRELEVAVMGNRDPIPSCVGEILAEADFYDYDAKYKSDETKTEIVKDLSFEKEDEIKEKAVRAYKALGCKGLARADFFLTEDNTVFFNEINTLPGFTSVSMYPKLWEESGIEYSELIDKLVNLAMEEI